MSSKFLTELSNDYENLFETEIGYDVIIYSGEEPNFKEIHAHSSILCIRSRYFRTAFSNEWAEKRDGKFIIRKPNISPQLFDVILRFIYCGNIELKNLQCPDLLKLLIAVDELNIQSLISHIQEYLIENQTEFLHQDPIGILETIYQHDYFTDLWNFCFKKICEKPKILFDSDKFINLKAPLLELLLKKDYLNVDEIVIWESLVKWSVSQQNLENDPTNWDKEDIIKVKRELKKFTPLIRFHDIGPTDFFYKVYCYKDILPRDLVHDLLEYHIVPNIEPKSNLSRSRKQSLKFKLDSNLVKPNHISFFASWIDKEKSLHYDNKIIPYNFKLLYRSSQDGFSTRNFHKNCDNKGATIWVAKIKGSTQLIGGYNPLDWCGNLSWKTTKDSFMFNFKDGEKISTAKVGYVNAESFAIFCHNDYGPTMGNLKCKFNNWYYDNYDDGIRYPKLGIPDNFKVEDYEVFQVIKE
ncbi:hypothetical protein GLOIN_2v1487162 [Rhizophagus irregularis DAOM 181602=DAOM 197198]|uniref:Btb/poz domain-containing protein 19-like n=3 Tax=Rhizophagus irregularis TaxID=588596 RepID=A0A015JZ50_RHIIW|nr:hypothetical protein GLOIN_2v1487162 [Rhizophagus irregularis DAOM 181602=DAOM 197198]EXX52446.1 hypothetical protein RirG_253020 [Rhizophagus irregularis DAOM 197198w]POG60267.1 hypothetical protein GLOIN_2v1487162 [Rhizophagus irregularis DAOM 181602=DAOM 197198]|eukprot:XP_025167133.1 hypothetical protein GLOIN_2v1487162 [Rhizophagus irregularis DAOM 181602=DAOM 197198]